MNTKKLKKDVVISAKFSEQVESLSVYEQLTRKNAPAYKGSINKLADDLYILKDAKGKDICGILDCQAFMDALLDTEVSHLWAYDNAKKYGSAN